MDVMEKLTILTDSAKYDAACTSSGADRPGKTVAAGCCHAFAADGRCISLLKVLLTNHCVYDCKYCVNRASNDCRRAAFYTGGARRSDDRILQAELYRGAVPVQRRDAQPGLHDGAHDPGAAPSALPL